MSRQRRAYRIGLFQGIKLDPETGCWNWDGPTFSGTRKYGRITFHGKREAVHRVSAHLYLGYDMKSGLAVLHKCDNPSCFNPKHLFVGTQLENIKDAISKGRMFGSRVLVCRHGHQYTPENTKHLKNGRKTCKTCNRARSVARYRSTHKLLTPEEFSELQRQRGRKSWSRGQGNRIVKRDGDGKFVKIQEASCTES